jgi:hypothetical protein
VIAYTLACEAGHDFESWFVSSSAYDAQVRRGLVSCPICGSTKVAKGLMTPSLARGEKDKPAPAPQQNAPPPTRQMAVFSEKERQLRDMVRALRKHVAENSDYVGRRFPEEARQMHNGEIEHRSIWGEASAEEAEALVEEGVQVQPLPPLPDDHN